MAAFRKLIIQSLQKTTKELFVSTGNRPRVDTLISMADIYKIFVTTRVVLTCFHDFPQS